MPNTATMEALQISGPDTLQQVTLPIPEPKDGEILSRRPLSASAERMCTSCRATASITTTVS